MGFAEEYAAHKARMADLESEAEVDTLVREMEAAGYTVRVSGDHHASRVRVWCKGAWSKVGYSETTSSTAGRANAIKATHAKWQKHREAVQP